MIIKYRQIGIYDLLVAKIFTDYFLQLSKLTYILLKLHWIFIKYTDLNNLTLAVISQLS